MTRRCDRCRAEYESGADFGGHDYCMTCYTIMRKDADRKRAEAEKLQQQRTDAKKHFLHLDYMASDEARLLRAREAKEDEGRRQGMLLAAKRREAEENILKKKKRDGYAPRNRVIGEELQIFTPLGRKKKPVPAAVPQKKNDDGAADPFHLLQRRQEGAEKKPKPPAKPQGQPALSLSVAAGLPVSLSIGQKQVQVFLIGKNASAAPVAAGLEVSVLDSQKSAIAAKAEPRTCTIEPEGESKIKVAFDLPEDAARGMLSFTALLKENAIYIDRQAAQSNTIALTSQVKSPMDLQYKCGSAAFESGALILTFQNVGESGGILEKTSSATYFTPDGSGKKALLASRTKIKGGEKNILLSFSPSEEAEISRLDISLSGTDSNGKPYSLKRKIEDKEAPAGDGKDAAE